ncbi:MAG TPA: DUF2339 domain-containing protein [Gammaproteobacteria bacterium]|nr:DUF2339 domain-containing protein [Gammaproteobacteria bacterium]
MAEIEQQLAALEARLEKIESHIGLKPEATAPGKPTAPAPAVSKPSTSKAPKKDEHHGPSFATQLLGWGGAAALVLAASYVIKLALVSGWLTPERQVMLAVLSAFAMIGVGWALRAGDRAYAGLLPAAGVVILFLSVYGAHLYYALIGVPAALSAVLLICILSLWLCHVFQSTLYAFFAVAGTYSAPFLLRSLLLDVSDLAVYYSCWSVVFCWFSIWVGTRSVYLLALYLALIGFDQAWRDGGHYEQWLIVVVFQAVQFLIFAGTAALYSVRRMAPMNESTATAHLPALLIFYVLQYELLDRHIPAYAPWVAVGSAAVLAIIYMVARALLRRDMPGGRMLLGAYIAIVIFHAGYLESVPEAWMPWVGLIVLPVTAVFGMLRGKLSAAGVFVWLAVFLIFVINYVRIVADYDRHMVVGADALSVLYPVELYGGYILARRANAAKGAWPLLLFAGHLAAIAAATHLFTGRIAVSLAWGALALGCLLASLSWKDKLLGQSSLLIFAISAGKVLFYDLGSSAPLVRIGTLIVVGVSFYVGGWLYRRIEAIPN